MTTTADLIHQAEGLIHQLANDGTEPQPEWLDKFGEWIKASEDKFASLAAIYKKLKADKDHIDKEIKRLTCASLSKGEGINRVKEMAEWLLSNQREMTGENSVKTDTGTVYFSSSKRVVAPSNPEEWPCEYVRLEPVLMKNTLREDLEKGKSVPGVTLEEKEHICIR